MADEPGQVSAMPEATSPMLSKSRFLGGLQCLKRLYLECYRRDLADEVSLSQQAIFDSGTAVGELARQRFPGGVLIAEDHSQHRQAVATTQTLLADPSIPALYEPAFIFQGIRTRVDILTRSDDGQFDFVEVKSGTSVKDVNLPDVAIQLHVLEGCGIPIRRAYLMHLDNSYVYQGGDHDLHKLFSLADLTDQAREYLSDKMPGELAQMWEALQLADHPDIATGHHCKQPFQCSFFGHCHQGEGEHPVRKLPDLRAKARQRLEDAGLHSISDIPANFTGLSALQRRVRDSVVADRPFIAPDLAQRLEGISQSASFLDFEALGPAIPLYVGTRPYQIIPFQWSLHVRDSQGALSHHEFLHDGDDDPREPLILSLLEAVPPQGPIVVYSSYEKTVINGLANSFPRYESDLTALIGRLVDLLALIRECYYHPQFEGSFSIKQVLPVLAPDLSYKDLDIQDGMFAAATYADLVKSITAGSPRSDQNTTRKQLLAYCQRDSEAMVRVLDALLSQSAR